MNKQYGPVGVDLKDYVAVVEMQLPPHNFFDLVLLQSLGDAFEDLDENADCRALVLAAQGKSFCAGANFQARADDSDVSNIAPTPEEGNPVYNEAVRLFACKKPVVGAIQGPAIGGGFGLALVPDFRVICPETRFSANFVKLGFHPGFALTCTLPELIGQQRSSLIFYTGRRIKGEQAFEWGLGDVLTSREKVREEAVKLAQEIAENAPLAVVSTRATMRQDIAARVKAHTDHEYKEQYWLRQTEDFKEGIRSVAERRPGNFSGR
jgi:enoyl-CoA hydratase/carnithine racemase